MDVRVKFVRWETTHNIPMELEFKACGSSPEGGTVGTITIDVERYRSVGFANLGPLLRKFDELPEYTGKIRWFYDADDL